MSRSLVSRARRGAAARARARSRKAALYRVLRRLHIAVALVTAVPLVVASLTGALLVFGHELEALVDPPATIADRPAPVLPYASLLERIGAQRPDARVWAVVPKRQPGTPWRIWLAGGDGILEVDPWTGDIVHAYDPRNTPYNVVRALHRRWLVDDKPASDWTRTIISATALALMVQAVIGIWMWGLPPRRLRRLVPVFSRSRRLTWQRLHVASGVVTALILLIVVFTGMSMYWTETTRDIVERLLPGEVEQLKRPDAASLQPVSDLDAAVAVAHRLIPEAAIASVRPPDRPGTPVHVALDTQNTRVNSRIWVGDAPPRVLAFFDGREASMATRFWHFRYWLHIGDFAGLPVRILWLVVSLMPFAFVISGLWLWRDRQRPGGARLRRKDGGRVLKARAGESPESGG